MTWPGLARSAPTNVCADRGAAHRCARSRCHGQFSVLFLHSRQAFIFDTHGGNVRTRDRESDSEKVVTPLSRRGAWLANKRKREIESRFAFRGSLRACVSGV